MAVAVAAVAWFAPCSASTGSTGSRTHMGKPAERATAPACKQCGLQAHTDVLMDLLVDPICVSAEELSDRSSEALPAAGAV